jgi:AcrR family transcriptional regulator
MIPNTRQKILDAAEKLFARQGFESTSLRSIIASAGVNLAAIHYHFRGKEGLIRAVIERRFARVNDERLRLLAEYENRAEGRTPLVEEILDAFLAPMLRLGLLHSGQGRLLMQLAGRLLQASDGMLEKAAGSEFERVAVRFLAAFQKAVPLTKQEIAWRMNFTIGAAARALFGGIPIRVLSSASHEDLQERDVERVLQRLIAYTAAGMKAPPGSQRTQES